jgi:hypothetical protein
MADNPKKKYADSRLVSTQKHEIDHLASQVGLPAPLVRNVVGREGPSRRAVVQYLEQMKRNRK